MPKHDRQRSKEKKWRALILQKDNFECKKCFSIKGLCAHHIKDWKNFPTLRYDVNNGLTLCRGCHASIHKNKKGKSQKAWNKGKKTGIAPWKGKKFSNEHKAKLSKAKENYKPWNIGIPMKESTKEIFRKRLKGKKWIIDPETGKRKWID